MSDKIIDLAVERSKRDAPDSECVKRDDFGREMFRFLLSYEMQGKSWGTEIWAYDRDDADRRAEAMRESLRVDGQLYREVYI